MKVGFASADWSQTVLDADGKPCMGGSGWIRIGQYSKFLEIDHAVGTLVYSKSEEIFGVTDMTGEHHLDCDIIYMQRWMLQDIPDNMRRAKAQGQIIINDVDDWYWGLSHRHRAKNFLDPKQNKEENTTIYREVLCNSDLVVVSTPFLANATRTTLGVRKVATLENCVDFEAFSLRKHTDGPTVIGWHGSTAHRSGDLDCLRDVFPYLDPDKFSFHHTGHWAGGPTFWDEVGVEQDRVQIYPLVSPQNVGLVLPFDVGVTPLTNIPFNHAKSWIKPLEYVAAGIPFVASKTPEYKRFQQRYGIGRFASKGADWKKHFLHLSKPEVRQSEALANWEAVQSLDVRQGALRLTKILESVA